MLHALPVCKPHTAFTATEHRAPAQRRRRGAGFAEDAPALLETPGRPRAPGRSRVSGPASAPLRCAGQRVRPRPCRAGPGSRLDATQRGAVRHRARCPYRNALGALRRAQAAAGRSSTRGRVGRRGGRTNDRPRGSAHVDGVKARRARAAAPSPPARLPAGRDEAGHHRTDRTALDASRNARRRTKPETSPARPPATSAPAEPPREAACTPPYGADALRAHHRPPRDPHDAPRDPRPSRNPNRSRASGPHRGRRRGSGIVQGPQPVLVD